LGGIQKFVPVAQKVLSRVFDWICLLMNWPRTLRLFASILLALLVVALGGWSVQRKVQSFQPLGFEGRVAGGGIAVVRVETPATGLRAGDQILMLPDAEAAGPAALAGRLRQQPQTDLTVLRGAELVVVKYQRPPLRIDWPFLILSLIGAAYLLIGLYTLLRKTDRQGFLFYLWALISAAFYLLSPQAPVDRLYIAIYLGDEIARLLLPALTLHLFLVFPTPLEARRWSERLIPFLYLPAAAFLALQADLALWNGRFLFGAPLPGKVVLLDRLEMLHLAVFAAAAVLLLVYRLIRERGWERQRQLQWMAFGLGGGYLPFLLLYGIPEVLGLRGPSLLTAVAVVPMALVPLSFAYAILRYKLWDIEVIVRDTISLTLTLLLGVIGFSLVNLAITQGVPPELAVAHNLLSFVAGLAIAGLLVPARNTISAALERLQYRGSFGRRRALSELGRELLHERDLGRLCSALLQEIEAGVDLERADLLLAQGGSLIAFRREAGLPERSAFDFLGDALWQKDVLSLSGLAVPGETPTVEQRLFAAGYRYAFPLVIRGRGVGVVLAGYRRDHTPLNSDDTELIRHLLNQAALAIENAQLMGQLHFQLEEVRTLQLYTEGIFESSPAGIAVLDEERRILSANAAFASLCAVERCTLIGRELCGLLPITPLPAAGEPPVEVSFCDAAGHERHLQVSLAMFAGSAGHAGDAGAHGPLRVLVVHDVSERVAMENTLKEKERLAALGMLAAGVAHEVNTPITGISSYAQMLLSETPESDPRHALLKKVERQTFRAARIVNNLLEFARNRQKDRKPVAVAPILRECADLLAERLDKRRVEVTWELPEEPALILGCEGELQQVFTNLLVNAADALSPAHQGQPGPAQAGKIAVTLEVAEASLCVRIADNGPGIPADLLETIFQPFYSTKLNRGGTGLGLSISHDIVRRHGGTLRAESAPGAGACFLVELPRLRSAPALAASSTTV
jgi:signal transduction histidine kinase